MTRLATRFAELSLATILLSMLLPAAVSALPEDSEQEIVSDYSSIDLFPEQGLVVFKGAADEPACITQGSLRICGDEIRLERTSDGSLKKVTASGTPARFQQQPAADQELVHASGLTLVFDATAQLVTIDENAELSQAGTVLTHQHIEYDLNTGNASAGGESGQGRMVIPPPQRGN
jgi:lipopolysaccharide export system protein LptA